MKRRGFSEPGARRSARRSPAASQRHPPPQSQAVRSPSRRPSWRRSSARAALPPDRELRRGGADRRERTAGAPPAGPGEPRGRPPRRPGEGGCSGDSRSAGRGRHSRGGLCRRGGRWGRGPAPAAPAAASGSAAPSDPRSSDRRSRGVPPPRPPPGAAARGTPSSGRTIRPWTARMPDSPCEPAAEQQPEEDGLGLVVAVMGGGHPAGVEPLPDLFEETVADPPGRGLGALARLPQGGHGAALGEERHPEPRGHLGRGGGAAGRALVETVIEMSRSQLEGAEPRPSSSSGGAAPSNPARRRRPRRAGPRA